MKWQKFTLTTTTAAVDLISSMLDEIGIEGIDVYKRQFIGWPFGPTYFMSGVRPIERNIQSSLSEQAPTAASHVPFCTPNFSQYFHKKL